MWRNMAQNQPKGTNNPNRRKRPAKKQALQNRTGLIIGVCVVVSVLLIVGIVCGIVALVNRNRDDGRILNNVYAAGVNLGGMTVDEAKSALHLATDNTFSVMDMVVQLPDAEIRLAPAQTGARLDVDAVVAEAYAYGRTGSEDERAAVRQAANEIRISNSVSVASKSRQRRERLAAAGSTSASERAPLWLLSLDRERK